MKISICGKGGSGKSTVVALLAAETQKRGFRVLVVDSDESNVGLFRMLGFDHPPISIMESLGGKQGLKARMSQPSVLSESDISIETIPQQYLLNKDGLLLVSIGKISQALEGCACPMGVLSREFLKKLNLKKNEIVIVDTEAGVEHFGRGVEASLDAVLIVVEPSFESLELTVKVQDMTASVGIQNVWAVLNKIPSPDIASQLEGELVKRKVNVIGCIHHDPEVFKSSLEGRAIGGGKAAAEIGRVLDCILGEANIC